MYRVLLFCCLVVIQTLRVKSDCGSSTGNIPEAKPVSEKQNGTVWNVTVDSLTNWTFIATKINQKDIPTAEKAAIEDYFSIEKVTLASNVTTLSFIIRQPLDKENQFWINASKGELQRLDFRIECTSPGSSVPKDIFITIAALNEFPPTLNDSFPTRIQVYENSSVGKTVFNIFPYIIDKDVPKPGMKDFTYTILSNTSDIQNDGSPWFNIPIASSDSIEIKKSPDFDQLHKHNMNILSLVIVVKANDESGFQLNRTLEIEILDVDDLPPYFLFPGCDGNCSLTPYEAYTGVAYRGFLTVLPVKLEARDQDTLNSPIIYQIKPTPNDYHTSFEINPNTAGIKQIGDVMKTDILTIMAQENTENGHFQTATLLIRLSNDSAYMPSASTSKKDSVNLKLVTIIVGAISLIIIGILIFLVIFVYKRAKKKMSVLPDPKQSSPETSVEDLVSDKPETIDEKVKNWTVDPNQWPTVVKKHQQLEPLSVRDESTETEESSIKKKRQRKKKKRLIEIFDGTKKFEEKADPEFYTNPDKKKIKRSTKSKNMRTDAGPLVIKSD